MRTIRDGAKVCVVGGAGLDTLGTSVVLVYVLAVLAPVVSLLLARGPSAVAWGVSSVVVYPLQRVLWGRLVSHVLKKFGEGVPPLTHHDAPTVVIVGLGAFSVLTSSMHLAEAAVLCAASSPNRVSVLEPVFRLKTSTTDGLASEKVAAENHFSSPA